MSGTIVLVHGAFHGGWCWRRVAEPLRAAGHTVFTPTLTGLGERAHLLTPQVGLATMVQDVLGLLEAEELTGVTLVGHSFGALPVLAAADRVPERVARVVLLDGLVVEPGTSGFDGLDPDVVAQREIDARRRGHGIAIPPPAAGSFGVTEPADAAWVTRRLTPHPLRSYREPLLLDGPPGAGLPVTYLRCTAPEYAPIVAGHELVKRAGWEWRDLPAAHDAMITAPDLVVDGLLSV